MMALFLHGKYFFLFTLVTLPMTIASMAISDKYDHVENSSLNNTKNWMTYLTYALKNWLHNTMFTNVQYLQEVRYPITHMIEWCKPPQLKEPNSIRRKSIFHYRTWAPCGYLMFTMDRMKSVEDHIVHWITVHRLFYIHYVFLTFEVEDSGITCEYSTVYILKPRNMDSLHQSWPVVAGYCGYREPWNITVEASRSVLYIKQINAYRSINITVKYATFHKSLKGFYPPEEKDTHLFLTSHQTLTFTQISKLQHQWVIKVDLGFVQNFKLLWMSEAVHHLNIFDGIKKLFPLFVFNRKESLSFNTTVHCTTQYFQSHIVLGNEYGAINHTLVNITFRIVKLDALYLHHNSRINLKSSSQIIHAVFSLKPFHRSFARLYLRFYEFHGWNWGGCNYGGYAIRQNIDDPILNSSTIGPFCSTSSPRHAYTSHHSQPNYVMNDRLAYLIIYGYGWMYTIDITIKVTSSQCMGILEPLLMWYPDKGKTRTILQDAISTNFAVLSIEFAPFDSMGLNHDGLNIITFRNISNCFYIQSLSYPSKKHITYDIFFHRGDTKINLYFPREHDKARLPGHVTLNFTQNFARPQLKEVTNYGITTIMDLQRLKIMQYTGEAYNYLGFHALIMPHMPKICADTIIKKKISGDTDN